MTIMLAKRSVSTLGFASSAPRFSQDNQAQFVDVDLPVAGGSVLVLSRRDCRLINVSRPRIIKGSRRGGECRPTNMVA